MFQKVYAVGGVRLLGPPEFKTHWFGHSVLELMGIMAMADEGLQISASSVELRMSYGSPDRCPLSRSLISNLWLYHPECWEL